MMVVIHISNTKFDIADKGIVDKKKQQKTLKRVFILVESVATQDFLSACSSGHLHFGSLVFLFYT